MKTEVFLERPPGFSSPVDGAGCFLEWEDKILHLKRSPGCVQENTWGIPGGKLEPGEAPKAAVIREVQEEVGIDIGVPESLGQLYVRLPHTDYIFYIFRKRFEKRPAVALKLDENCEARWLTVPEALELPLIHGGAEALRFYQG